MAVEWDARYPAARGVWGQGRTACQLLTTSCCRPRGEPPLTCDGDDILLHDHTVAEVGVAAKEQHHLAALAGLPHVLHLYRTGSGGGRGAALGKTSPVGDTHLLPASRDGSLSQAPYLPSLGLCRLTFKLVMWLSMASSWSLIMADNSGWFANCCGSRSLHAASWTTNN